MRHTKSRPEVWGMNRWLIGSLATVGVALAAWGAVAAADSSRGPHAHPVQVASAPVASGSTPTIVPEATPTSIVSHPTPTTLAAPTVTPTTPAATVPRQVNQVPVQATSTSAPTTVAARPMTVTPTTIAGNDRSVWVVYPDGHCGVTTVAKATEAGWLLTAADDCLNGQVVIPYPDGSKVPYPMPTYQLPTTTVAP